MKKSNKSGFTLIEIIVVLIIVGILAAIALPNLFKNVAKSKSAEALTTISALKSEVEACLQGHTSSAITTCAYAPAVGATIVDPTATSNGYTYVITNMANAITAQYTITATYVATGDTIVLQRAANGTFTCTGSGDFLGAC